MTTSKARRGPHVARGPRCKAAIESVYNRVYMRSLFEVEFAKQLDRRAIQWAYEPERIGGGHYLVDFYLPDLKCWVEVKGRFEARDDLLLPLAATHLKNERGERLFLYMKTRAYRVTTKGFEPITHDEFWLAIQAPPDEDPLQRKPTRGRRRPWERDKGG
jgi:hypothetical protein